VERRLKAELDEVLAGRMPTFADLLRLTYTKMVMEESLRLLRSFENALVGQVAELAA
jgi:hypothetical protein